MIKELSENLIQEKISCILAWDMQDVCDLRDYINDLKTCLYDDERKADDLIDFSKLPTQLVPDELTSYPVWAMDKSGHCLVGREANDIEHISEISRIINDDKK